ncbi:hypothetical protein KZZ20_07940 [Methylacidiphilum fumariolicum]|uniref:Uncharacterized protein n=2 Tax=Candidatus Methylacidiphilum fumarolicum TaxID=591154 RepID=I0JZI9_METFB|nr:hypothetical protein [Candidatus Methylacidiphilum fumarolicum]MBW6415439.1 hypothetical protein [Candidatus Methylacidiphilum fumarolicum]CAI9085209.1 conserved protein of unknown function [Candidatus Methylacidiphilum fumarolicum]CCG92658.1 hypothetical protein MFUM_720024 [Methylacidiphilum fumariolicum SolV]
MKRRKEIIETVKKMREDLRKDEAMMYVIYIIELFIVIWAISCTRDYMEFLPYRIESIM